MQSGSVFTVSLAVAAILCSVTPCTGYTMQFSLYANPSISSDGQTLYAYESVTDESTCYNHYNYVLTANIYTPDGRHAQASQTGLTATASIALNDMTGDYNLVATGTYYCGCANLQSGFGLSSLFPLRKTVYSLYSWPGTCTRTCSYLINCGTSTATCGAPLYSTYETTFCGPCPQWVKVYYWWLGYSCLEVAVLINPVDKTCS